MGDGNTLTLPAPGDFKVTATFPKAAASSTPAPITLNASVSVPGPGGIPAYGAGDKPKNGLFGKVGHHVQSPALIYVTFESDKGATISGLPVIDVIIPLSVLERTAPILRSASRSTIRLTKYKWTKDIAQAINATPTPIPLGGGKATATPDPDADTNSDADADAEWLTDTASAGCPSPTPTGV